LIKGLREVSPQVFDVLDPNRHPYQSFRYREQLASPPTATLHGGLDSTEAGGNPHSEQPSINVSALFASARSMEISEPNPGMVR